MGITYIAVRGAAAIYYTTVGLQKMLQRTHTQRTHRQTEKAITEATLIVDGSLG